MRNELRRFYRKVRLNTAFQAIDIGIPLFQLCLLKVRLPELETRNGPNSAKKPSPTEEHPGPIKDIKPKCQILILKINVAFCRSQTSQTI